MQIVKNEDGTTEVTISDCFGTATAYLTDEQLEKIIKELSDELKPEPMKYICKKTAFGLSVGEHYKEQMVNPNSYNACVIDNHGSFRFIPRAEFFDIED